MEGTGTELVCRKCGAVFSMSELGEIKMISPGNVNKEHGDTEECEEQEFSHIPDWYKWERKQVRNEIEAGTYKLDIPVDIKVLKDLNAIYEIGEGRLVHDMDGFKLTGCDGKLSYTQTVNSSYSLYSDYFWYEIGDMICIGDNKILYYCFPKDKNVVVAKARLATEEMYDFYK